MEFPGIFDALLLIALGVGYMVIYFAKKEEKRLQFTGYLIGGIIIALAVIYLFGAFLLQVMISFPRIQKRIIRRPIIQQPFMPKAPAQTPQVGK